MYVQTLIVRAVVGQPDKPTAVIELELRLQKRAVNFHNLRLPLSLQYGTSPLLIREDERILIDCPRSL
jgi:hypothetical protein